MWHLVLTVLDQGYVGPDLDLTNGYSLQTLAIELLNIFGPISHNIGKASRFRP